MQIRSVEQKLPAVLFFYKALRRTADNLIEWQMMGCSSAKLNTSGKSEGTLPE
ncbi:hypothetical protein [Pantoea sp. B65]|uniref:hypothetical protein n=1 Tax=Pantoea sp. B65 TaxID=2813359 RepID=UPI0039B6A625